MTEADRNATPSGSNGRRTAIIVILVAFIASATTTFLAITESHRVRKADTVAQDADVRDLRAFASDWASRVEQLRAAPAAVQPERLAALPPRIEALAAWKPRTPCGNDAREALRASMETRVGYVRRVLAKDTVPEAHIDEGSALEQSLQRCIAEQGRDVTT
ncbi:MULTISPECIES: hypothetical protein [unclassified Luteibacter]|uniref:hypothetical protein n=1 Tax=Luteibacter sp. PvP019 TaxID=3156436 RepID=UPI00339A1ED2